MQLTTEEMDAILQANIDLIENDPNSVALKFDIDKNGEVIGLVLIHQEPTSKSIAEYGPIKTVNELEALPLRIELGEIPEEDIASFDVLPKHKSILDKANIGLSGTKVCEGTGCGTLCLSGSKISLKHGGITYKTNNQFLFSNSHVFHKAKGIVKTEPIRNRNGEKIGTVKGVFDLEAKTTFDGGIAEANSNVPHKNAFKVYNSTGKPLEIKGLLTAKTGMKIAKMGMVTGWTTGKIGSPIITRVRGHAALYHSWVGNYISDRGDSGSPILTKDDRGFWYLVGIHFSSGPRFQSWNNVDISVSRN